MRSKTLSSLFRLGLSLTVLSTAGRADLMPDWIAQLPVGSSLSAGFQGAVTDATGVTYVTGVEGPSFNTDVVTAAFDADGALLWSRTFNGPGDWHDQARAIALGPNGTLWVAGNTPGAGNVADVLLLQLDAAAGALLQTVQYTSGPFTSEHGSALAVDSGGNVYVGGGTVGDGADGMILKFDPGGQLVWRRTWDGPASGPFSQDSVRGLALDPNGDVVVLIHGVMASQQPDFVVVKYAPADGATIWQASWNGGGADFPNDFTIDAAGDVYVTGTALELFTDRFSTIKLAGGDGHLVWQAYDGAGLDDSGFAIALDEAGGVYVTGAVDPDGDQSNFNENIYAVRRDAATGALTWTFLYGANCVGCFDSPSDVIVDAAGHVFVAGTTSSAPYSGDVITFVLDAGSGVELDRGVLGDQQAGTGTLAFDAEFNLYNAAQTKDPNTGVVELTAFRYGALEGSPPTVYCTAKTSSAGCLASIGTSDPFGQPTSGAGGYTVEATGVQGFKNGLLFGSNVGPANLPFHGGTLCVSPPTKRGPIVGSGGTNPSSCDGAYTTTVNTGLVFPVGLDAGSGNSGWYQYWYRDPKNGVGQLGTALSDAVRLDFQ